jgi:hypothetical protein
MNSINPFKWRHFAGALSLLGVRWYLRDSLAYRDREEMMVERGLSVNPSTICRSRPPLRAAVGATGAGLIETHHGLLAGGRDGH